MNIYFILNEIKQGTKKLPILKNIFQYLKKEREKYYENLKIKDQYVFINRQGNQKKLCIILAGYKPYLYSNVFARVGLFLPSDIDVCIVSSGVYSKELEEIATSKHWSYLSTRRNCVTLAQNIAIILHKSAKMIFKMDEDIFVTQECFEKMLETYEKVSEEGIYDVGFVAPILPVNGYGYYRLLEKLNLKRNYQDRFESPAYTNGPSKMIENNPKVAKFFWGENNIIPSIDELNIKLQNQPFEYSVCPIRFSIGFFLIKRDLWEDMGMWNVLPEGTCMGIDEEQLCIYCMLHSKAIIVSENTVVGHLAFKQQNTEMRGYYLENQEKFICPTN